MKRYLLVIAVIGFYTANAQYVSNYKKVGDRFYAQGDYHSAAGYYEKYLGGKTPDQSDYAPYIFQKQGTRIGSMHHLPSTLVFRLADSYMHTNNYELAAPWYKLLVDKYVAEYPQARYWYAACLRAKGDYTGALTQLENFLLKYPIYDQYMEQAHQEIDVCMYIRKQLNNPVSGVQITKLDNHINKEGASYAAGWMNGSTMVFTSTRATGNAAHCNALYKSSISNEGFAEAEKINISVAQDQQLGTASFSPDGNRMYFTGWVTGAAGKKLSAIYCSERIGEAWGGPVLIDGSETYNSRQPQVTPDGKYLLFASDRSGGVGGFDIWFATLDNNGKATGILNMGPAINTTSDDEAPFFHAGSSTLVFASRGRVGMGGFDLFSANGSFTTSWKEAENMGYPINSVKDDIYFVGRGSNLLDDAAISSDRSSACCLELFFVHKTQVGTVAGR